MKFALFYEIPVARPWNRESEFKAYRDTIEQAVFGEAMGFHSFWTVEHHFLEEFPHCSNPEVLYGAIAARTEKFRIGYGVRLQPQPYNHPVRSAESARGQALVAPEAPRASEALPKPAPSGLGRDRQRGRAPTAATPSTPPPGATNPSRTIHQEAK